MHLRRPCRRNLYRQACTQFQVSMRVCPNVAIDYHSLELDLHGRPTSGAEEQQKTCLDRALSSPSTSQMHICPPSRRLSACSRFRARVAWTCFPSSAPTCGSGILRVPPTWREVAHPPKWHIYRNGYFTGQKLLLIPAFPLKIGAPVAPW
jgi:hypothetical protein